MESNIYTAVSTKLEFFLNPSCTRERSFRRDRSLRSKFAYTEILESDQKSDESLSPNHSARRALISEICIPFTLSRLRLDNSAGRGVRHSSYFEIHRLVVGMTGGWVALRSYREGGGGGVRRYKRTAFRYMLNIPYSESRQHRWLIYGRVEHSCNIGFIAAYTRTLPPLRYQPPPTSLIRQSNIYGKVG